MRTRGAQRSVWGTVLVIVLAIVATSAPAAAQPRGPTAAKAQQRREAIKKKVRALRAYTLTEELGLDEKTAAKLFPVLSRWDDVTDKLLVQRADIQKRIAGSSTILDPKILDGIVDDAIANQKAFWELEDKRLAELRKILTPAQSVKLLDVLPTFERRIQNQIQRAIAGGRQQRRPARGRLDRTDDDHSIPSPYPPLEKRR